MGSEGRPSFCFICRQLPHESKSFSEEVFFLWAVLLSGSPSGGSAEELSSRQLQEETEVRKPKEMGGSQPGLLSGTLRKHASLASGTSRLSEVVAGQKA